MARSKHQQMRDAINDIELALNNLEIDALVKKWEGASDAARIIVSLGALRRLGACYPELNQIINDPAFEVRDISSVWQELVEKDDRTSPEEYPDMALITRDELADFLAR